MKKSKCSESPRSGLKLDPGSGLGTRPAPDLGHDPNSDDGIGSCPRPDPMLERVERRVAKYQAKTTPERTATTLTAKAERMRERGLRQPVHDRHRGQASAGPGGRLRHPVPVLP